jgi:hypothetical protein
MFYPNVDVLNLSYLFIFIVGQGFSNCLAGVPAWVIRDIQCTTNNHFMYLNVKLLT